MGFPGGLAGKNLPATQEPQETQIRCVGQEDPLEKVMATHFSILAWRTPWTEESGGLQSIGLKRVGHNWSNLAAAAAYKQKNHHPYQHQIIHQLCIIPKLNSHYKCQIWDMIENKQWHFPFFLNESCNSYYLFSCSIHCPSFIIQRGTCVLKEAPKHAIMHGISSILVWGQKAKQLLLCTKLLIHKCHNNRTISLLPGLLGGSLWALPSRPWGQYSQQTLGTSRRKGFIVEKKFLALEPSCSSDILQINLCNFPGEEIIW